MRAEIIRANLADRTGRTLRHYEAMFGELPVEPGQTLVNVGAGDSALGNELPDVDVIDVDYGYHRLPPLYEPATCEQRPYRGTPVASLAHDIPLEDSVADCTVASFLFRHMGDRIARLSLDEFIRITEPGGKILIGPVGDNKNIAPSLKNEYITFRLARYSDGWMRMLHSMFIEVPEDKAELGRLHVAEALVQSGILGNRPFWKSIGTLARECLGNCFDRENANRRFDISGRTYRLERGSLAAPATDKQEEPQSTARLNLDW